MHLIKYVAFFFIVGLKYDREWLLQGSGGEILTQKKVADICPSLLNSQKPGVSFKFSQYLKAQFQSKVMEPFATSHYFVQNLG